MATQIANAAPIQQFRNLADARKFGHLRAIDSVAPKVSNAFKQTVKAGCGAAVNQKRAAQRPLR
jgi:hypothetical protein